MFVLLNSPVLSHYLRVYFALIFLIFVDICVYMSLVCYFLVAIMVVSLLFCALFTTIHGCPIVCCLAVAILAYFSTKCWCQELILESWCQVGHLKGPGDGPCFYLFSQFNLIAFWVVRNQFCNDFCT